MLVRRLWILSLALLVLASSSSNAQLGGSPLPVDLTDTTNRLIFWESESTVCDVSVRPNQTGCTTTSNDPGAVFDDPPILASLTF